MDECQIHTVSTDLVNQAVAFMRNQLAGAGYGSGFAEHGCSVRWDAASLNSSSILAAACGLSVAMCSRFGAVELRFRCPNDIHGARGTRARRAENSASTASSSPLSARMDARPASTLRRRNSSYSLASRCRCTKSRISSRSTWDAGRWAASASP